MRSSPSSDLNQSTSTKEPVNSMSASLDNISNSQPHALRAIIESIPEELRLAIVAAPSPRREEYPLLRFFAQSPVNNSAVPSKPSVAQPGSGM